MFGTSSVNTGALGNYINILFQVGIAIAGVLGIIMIVAGGFTYMTTDSFSKTEKGREIIKNAIFGVILALVSWILLNTINPNLTNLQLGISTASAPAAELFNNYYNFTEDGIAVSQSSGCQVQTMNCPTCAPLTINSSRIKPSVQQTGHNKILPALNAKLALLEGDSNDRSPTLNWRVTEAWEPTIPNQNTNIAHCSSCHYNGTCVDVGLTGASSQNSNLPQSIIDFVNYADARGLRAVWEVGSESQYNWLVNDQGVPESMVLHANITAPHFSVYNN